MEVSNFAACLASPDQHQERPGWPGQQDPSSFAAAQDNSHANQNDYSSDILLKMKGVHPQVATRGPSGSPSKLPAEVARTHVQPQVQVPTVSAFKM